MLPGARSSRGDSDECSASDEIMNGWSRALQPVIGKVVWMEKVSWGWTFGNCPWGSGHEDVEGSRGGGSELCFMQVNMCGLTAVTHAIEALL